MSGEILLMLSMERTAEAKTCIWWRPDGAGYTDSLAEAGHYTRETASRHVDPPHHVAIPLRALTVPASAARQLVRDAEPLNDRLYARRRERAHISGSPALLCTCGAAIRETIRGDEHLAGCPLLRGPR